VLTNPPPPCPSVGIRMPQAKFRADPVKTVAVHNEQSTYIDSIIYI